MQTHIEIYRNIKKIKKNKQKRLKKKYKILQINRKALEKH